MPDTIKVKIDGTPTEFVIGDLAHHPDLEAALKDLVAEIGPFRRPIEAPRGAELRRFREHAVFAEEVAETLSTHSALSGEQVAYLGALMRQAAELGPEVLDGAVAGIGLVGDVDALQVAVGADRAYLLWLSNDPKVPNEVLFETSADNKDGVDWLDVILQLIGEGIGLALGLKIGAAGIKKLREAIGDGLAALLRSPRIQKALKELAEVLGGGKIVEIGEKLKELVEALWDARSVICTDKLKEWLKSLMSIWRAIWMIAGWILAFLSGGSSKLGQAVAVAAGIGLKFIRPVLTPETT